MQHFNTYFDVWVSSNTGAADCIITALRQVKHEHSFASQCNSYIFHSRDVWIRAIFRAYIFDDYEVFQAFWHEDILYIADYWTNAMDFKTH